jgi:poly(A) polymerase
MTAPAANTLDAPWLSEGPAAKLLAILNRDGEEARVIGGAVRDALLGLPMNATSPIDMATTALPTEVVRRVAATGSKAVPTGIEHGTITAIVDGHPIEVTTLRQDVETFGRKARVVFGRDWKADAERRDFTINALSAGPDRVVHDYVGGLADMAERRVRFIGEPQRRIEEDYLRILRFFRFHAHYGAGAPDYDGVQACIRGRAGLEMLSRERVRAEMLKLLSAGHATPTLAVMAESGLLGMVLGGVAHLASFENVTKLEAALDRKADPLRRLGALAVWVDEDAERLGERLRLSNAELDRLRALNHWWRIAPASGATPARALLYRLGAEPFVDRVLIAWSRSEAGAAETAWRELATLPQHWPVPVFPLKAADFMTLGLAAGPALGAALRTAEAAWIAADFPADRLALDAIAKDAVAQSSN